MQIFLATTRFLGKTWATIKCLRFKAILNHYDFEKKHVLYIDI